MHNSALAVYPKESTIGHEDCLIGSLNSWPIGHGSNRTFSSVDPLHHCLQTPQFTTLHSVRVQKSTRMFWYLPAEIADLTSAHRALDFVLLMLWLRPDRVSDGRDEYNWTTISVSVPKDLNTMLVVSLVFTTFDFCWNHANYRSFTNGLALRLRHSNWQSTHVSAKIRAATHPLLSLICSR